MCNNSNISRAFLGAGNCVLCAVLAPAVALGARPAEAAPFAYVANSGSNTVSVIDTATNKVVATVPVGTNPAGVAVTPDGTKVYVANENDNTVSVIRTATNTVVRTVPVGTAPVGVAVSPDGTKVYVANFKSNNVSVIARPGNTVVATIPVGSGPSGVAVTLDGAHVYVTETGDVSVIATATNTVVATVSLVRGHFFVAQGVAVSPDGKNAYVAYYTLECLVFFSTELSTQCRFAWLGTLAVIATASNTVVSSVSLDTAFTRFAPPQGVAVTPDGTHVYVTKYLFGSVWIIASNSVVARVTVGSNPLLVAFTPDGAHAYVANNGSNNVSVIATSTNSVVATVPVGANPRGVGIIP
jgi:YVTN family beta-propeller protein